jgi:hypothetical protein
METPFFDMVYSQLRERMQSPIDNQWTEHAMNNAQLFEKYQELFGGYNEKASRAKGFRGGADFAQRYPKTPLEYMKLLSFLYQMGDLAKTGLFQPSKFNPAEEFDDYRANRAGLEMVKKLQGSNIPPKHWNDLLEQAALDYADPFGDTTK